jgi:hypothetical protein
LPGDFVRLLTIGDRILYGGNVPTRFFSISSDGAKTYLYCDNVTDQGGGAPGLRVEYIFDAVTVPLFDSLFVNVLARQLARNIAYKFTLKSSLVKDLESALAGAHLKAAAVSGQEKPPRRIQRSRIRDVRRSGGIFRNNTVI